MTIEPQPPEPSQPTPPVTVDVSNGGELTNPLDVAHRTGSDAWGPLGTGTEPPEPTRLH